MLLVAAADGHVDEKETAVLSALARTVPDLRAHDVSALFASARTCIDLGLDYALAPDLSTTPAWKNKAASRSRRRWRWFAGLTWHEETLLPRLVTQLEPGQRRYADAAIATFAAKYA